MSRAFDAVIFDLDGVLTDTVPLHFRAWKETFDELLGEGGRGGGEAGGGFTHDDYVAYVDGKPRYQGVASFLASRGMELPFGGPDDPPDRRTVCGVGNRKNQRFHQILERDGITAHAGSRRLLELLAASGHPVGVASSSKNARHILAAAGLDRLTAVVIDGEDSARRGLAGKPAPDIFLTASEELGAAAGRTVVVEDALAGVRAAVAGRFGMIVGVARHAAAEELAAEGADLVVDDLSELALPVLEGWFARGLPEDQWKLVEHRFVPAREPTGEALCTVGNGFFATRGAAEESRAGEVHYPGTYLAGVYNRLTSNLDGHRLVHEDLVNAPNWLPVRFEIDGEGWQDLADAEVVSFRRTLYLDLGLLDREVILRDARGRETRVHSRRLVSMAEPHLAALRYRLEPINYRGRVRLRSGLDGGVENLGVRRYRQLASRHLEILERGAERGLAHLQVCTSESGIGIAMVARSRFSAGGEPVPEGEVRGVVEGAEVFSEVVVTLEPGRALELEKVVAVDASHRRDGGSPLERAWGAAASAPGFDALAEESRRAWERLWEQADLVVEGDRHTQKLLRFQIYHLLVTAGPHHALVDSGLPGRGLHGEAYRGHIFWDDAFVLPWLAYHFPEAARSALGYRVRRLAQARANAAEAGLPGAMYPWQSGSDGREETPILHLNPDSGRWGQDHSRLQRHVSLAVAYSIWRHFEITADLDFLADHGAEVVLEIARFWAAKAQPEAGGRCSICGVMGPDEFHEFYPGAAEGGLRDNAYTNLMAAWVLGKAVELLEELPADAAGRLREKIGLASEELERWHDLGRRFAVPVSEDGVLEQFDGFFSLAELDWEAYRSRYGRIARLDRILKAEGDSPDRYQVVKQADTLMLFYWLGPEEVSRLLEQLGIPASEALLATHFDYYYPRTSHGSTLSGLVHGRLAQRLGRKELAWELFDETLRADYDDVQGGTTAEGIHVGAMAGTVLWVLEEFAGVSTFGGRLRIRPDLPASWRRLGCRFCFRSCRFALAVQPDRVRLEHLEGPAPVAVDLVGETVELAPGEVAERELSPPPR